MIFMMSSRVVQMTLPYSVEVRATTLKLRNRTDRN